MNEFILKYGVALLTLTILCVSGLITFARCMKDKRKENRNEKIISKNLGFHRRYFFES